MPSTVTIDDIEKAYHNNEYIFVSSHNPFSDTPVIDSNFIFLGSNKKNRTFVYDFSSKKCSSTKDKKTKIFKYNYKKISDYLSLKSPINF
jgi:hypothetical protein